MGKNPAFQFYPADWERDLGEHPLEVEGAWIRICCKLWWSKTKGKDSKTLGQWARILGVNLKKAREILGYLRSEEICILEGDLTAGSMVTVASRRMIRDEQVRAVRRKAGRLGGNPALKLASRDLTETGESRGLPAPKNLKALDAFEDLVNHDLKHPVNLMLNHQVNHPVNQNPTPSTSSSSSILKQKKNKAVSARAAAAGYSPEFEIFWNEYPSRNGKKALKAEAFAEWKRLSPGADLQRDLLLALKQQKQNYELARSQGEWIAEFPDACRWLKKRRWEDEVKDEKQVWTEKVRTAQ
jgi:hypothetical protein